MIPRAVKKKGTTPAASAATPAPLRSSSGSQRDSAPAAGPSMLPRSMAPRTKVNLPMPSTLPPRSTSPPPYTAAQKKQHEALIYAIECAVSDYGLSVYHAEDLLPAFRDSNDGFVHIQHLLKVQHVRALSHSQADVQAALKSRPSIHFTLSDDAFSLRRTHTPDYGRLERTSKEDWNSCMIYLENVPTPTSGPSTPSSLSQLLSSIFRSPIQRLSLPPHPSSSSHGDDQESAFRASLGPTFPVGGGQFRGFCFVVVESENVGKAIVEKWSWDRDAGETSATEEMDEKNEKEEGDGDEKMDDEPPDVEKPAREAGLRAIPLARYYTLQAEYLAYRQSILRASSTKAPPAPRPPQPVDSGAYPVGCILWLRNTHPKSTRPVLLGVFRHLLEELEEGSGAGVEFVDVEKGVDQCHCRFSSAHLASLVLNHFNSHPTLHISPGKLTPFDSPSSPAPSTSGSPSNSDIPTRPIIAQLLTGAREKLYWANLPEAARKHARQAAKGVGETEKVPRKVEQEERRALEEKAKAEMESETGRTGKRSVWDGPADLLEEKVEKRKKPNKA